MPWATDADLNKHGERTIIFTELVDCPDCTATHDVEFDTGAVDEDALTDLGVLESEVTCFACGKRFTAEHTGWSNYGDAG